MAAWALFAHWITLGRGFHGVVAGFGPVHGLYAAEAALSYAVLPAVSLVTLALMALVLVLQVLHRRCGAEIEAEGEGRWRWRGRKGPGEIVEAVRTPGGWWLRDGGRWHFVAAGYVDGEGRPWRPEAARRRRWLLSLLSPPVFLLGVLVVGAFALSRPYARYWELRREAYGIFLTGDTGREAALVAAHPEFRPWLLYLSTLRTCRRADCLSEQIRDRLELLSLGPAYGADGATLFQLLLLNGRPRMALVLAAHDPVRAFQVAVRLGDPAGARAILAGHPQAPFQRAQGAWILFLLEEGRAEEAYAAAGRQPDVTLRRSLSLLAAAAHLSGRCEESRRHAALLMTPEMLREARLVGEAPETGLGALQRAASDLGHRASVALGLCLLGDTAGARRVFGEAEALAAEAGIPGYLDTDRVLLRLVNPAAYPLGTGSAALPRPGSRPA
ncbi:MAG: hypothetical protein ACP5VN_11020 [Acidobacteriota bacterium]